MGKPISAASCPPCSEEFWLLPTHQKSTRWGISFLTLFTSLWHQNAWTDRFAASLPGFAKLPEFAQINPGRPDFEARLDPRAKP